MGPTRGRARRLGAVGALGALVLVMVGTVAGLALAPEPAPDSLTAPPAVTSAPVAYESFDDARRTPFVLVAGDSSTVPLLRAGTVTSLTCDAGGTLASGDVALTIDSTPVTALHTSYPLWRDLVSGDTGPDVAAVQSELVRLGYRPGSAAVMDRATQRALTAFFTDRGYPRPDGSLSRSAVVWLPAPELVVSDCAVSLAQVVAAGDTFVTTGGGLVALRPAVVPEGWAPGPRTVSFAASSGPVDADGGVTDPAFLAEVSSSADYRFAVGAAGEGSVPQLTFTTQLAAPLTTAVLPAGALFGVADTSGCISSGGVDRPVTIVSSLLGSTYVTIDDGSAPTTVDLQSPADRTSAAQTCS